MVCQTSILASSQVLGRERCLYRESQSVLRRHWEATVSTDIHHHLDNVSSPCNASCNKKGWACGVVVPYILSYASSAPLQYRVWPDTATWPTLWATLGPLVHKRMSLPWIQPKVLLLNWNGLRNRFFKGVWTLSNEKRPLSGMCQPCFQLLYFHLQDFTSFWKPSGACLHLWAYSANLGYIA